MVEDRWWMVDGGWWMVDGGILEANKVKRWIIKKVDMFAMMGGVIEFSGC